MRKILIDSVYSHNYGGFEILNNILNGLSFKNSIFDITLLIDSRLNFEIDVRSFKKIKLFKCNPNEFDRIKFYNQKFYKCEIVLCLSNVPPPFFLKNKKVIIYFHNINFLKIVQKHLGIKLLLKNLIKKNYIKLKNHKNYVWIVQTNLVLELLKPILKKGNNVKVYPIFDSTMKSVGREKLKNAFIYPASSEKHKNHDKLYKAFLEVSKLQPNNDIELNLTLSEKDYFNSCYNKIKPPKNLHLYNHGIIPKYKLYNIYEKCEYLIYPSYSESFGLPLVESIKFNCKVIASDLPYVNSIIKPSLTFDPRNTKDICNSIVHSMNSNLPQSKIKVNNQVSSLIKFVKSL